MDLMIVAPGNHRGIFQGLAEKNYPAIEPPVWAGMIAKFAQIKGYSVDLIDQPATGMSSEQIVAEISEKKPKIIAVVVYGHQPSASTQTMTVAEGLIDKIKLSDPNFKTILIGGHPSALPRQTLLESRVDFVCQGEGPQTIDALLSLGEKYEISNLKKVPGLWFKEEGNASFGTPSSVIPQDRLSVELPGVAWDLLPMQNYRAHNWHAFSNNFNRQPYASIYTSLGCPFKCSFCCINAPFGRPSIRYWDPNFILTELEKLSSDYGVVNLKIVDEMFVLNEKHVFGLCDGIIERGLNFNIWAYARIDTVKPKFLEKLKKAGVNWLVLGIESGSKHVRDGVNKGRFGMIDIKETVRLVQDHGIHVHGNYIFGLPDEDLGSMNETLDLALDLNTEFANFYSAMAYPGSKLYSEAVKNGWKLPEKWEDYSQHSFGTLPLPTQHLSAGEVLGFRDGAWKKYFSSQRFQNMLGEKFGANAVSHIQEMTQVTLKREHAKPIQI